MAHSINYDSLSVDTYNEYLKHGFFFVDPYNVRSRSQVYGTKTFAIELRNKNYELVKVLTKKVKRNSLGWSYNRIGGCGNCTIDLAMSYEELLDYINPDYDIRIFCSVASGSDAELVYRGFVEEYRPKISVPDGSQISVSGYSGQLRRVPVIRTYTSTEVSSIVKSILDNDVIPNTSLFYESADIEDTGFVVDTIEFETMADDALGTLARIAGNFEYGVDKDLNFYFKRKSSDISHFYRIKKDVANFDEILDYSEIINRYIIKGKDGYSDTINNTESQTLYGIRAEIISNSSITTSAISQRYGAMLMLDSAIIARRASADIVNMTALIEASTPLGRLTVIKEPIRNSPVYNDGGYYGDGGIYGKFSSYEIQSIKYGLNDEKLKATVSLGQPRPSVAEYLEQMQFQMDQIRNA